MTNAVTLDTNGLTESLTILFNNFPCLQVTCAHVGIPDDITIAMVVDLPACVDPPLDIAVAGYEGTYARMREVRGWDFMHLQNNFKKLLHLLIILGCFVFN